jgi:hypothetical protein
MTAPPPHTSAARAIPPLLIAAVAVLSRIFILRATHSTTEDFYITLRYAENIAAGHGFVYNLGERVLGATTPLYTLILAASAALHVDPVVFGKALNILAEGATCWLIARILALLGRPRAGWIAALLYATASAPISISIGGMETGLVALAGLCAIYAYIQRKPVALAGALGVLFLLRIDGLLLAVVLAGGWHLTRPKQANTPSRAITWKSIGLFGLLTLPWMLFATLYFGSPVPTSLTAKVLVYARTRQGTFPNLPEFKHQFLGGGVQIILFTLFLVGLAAAWRACRPLRAPIVWMALYYLIMLFSRVPCFGWYFVPPLPLYYICVALGVSSLGVLLMSYTPPKIKNQKSKIKNMAVLLLALPLLWHLRSVTRDIAEAQKLEDTVRRPLGEWLAKNTAPTDRIMLEPIGYIGYFSGRPVLDIIGLVSPEVIPFYRKEVGNPLAEIVRRFHPEVLVLRPAEQDQLLTASQGGHPLLDGEYLPVLNFPEGSNPPVFFIYHRRPAAGVAQ